MTNFLSLELSYLQYEMEFSWIPQYILFNSVMQFPVWYYTRRKQWNFFNDLAIVNFTFLSLICVSTFVDAFIQFGTRKENIVQTLIVYFITFYIAHLFAYIWGELVANVYCSNLPHYSGRVKEKSILYMLWQEMIQATVDAAGYAVLFYLAPFDLTVIKGSPPNPIETAIGTALIWPVPDLVFHFFHGVILHGPMYFSHRAHHQIYRPTVRSARVFDALDWFFEATMAVSAGALALNYVLLQATGNFHRYFWTMSLTDAFFVSMIHHCGKPGVPSSASNLVPILELYSRFFGTTIVDLHEGHHNWVNANYGVIGFSDWLFGTYKPPKQRAVHGGAGPVHVDSKEKAL